MLRFYLSPQNWRGQAHRSQLELRCPQRSESACPLTEVGTSGQPLQ